MNFVEISLVFQDGKEPQVGEKRKRSEEEDLVKSYLEEFAAMPLDGLEPEEAAAKAKELYCRIEESAKTSPYIANLIASAWLLVA